MSSDNNFLKTIRSEKAQWLLSNFSNAYLVLNVIALRARRSKDEVSGLEAGDCIIGRAEGAKAAGITEDKFRTALDRLIEFNFVKIVFNPAKKNAENVPSRILKIPIKCLVVNICNSEVFDINIKKEGLCTKKIPTNKKEQIKKKEIYKEKARVPLFPLPPSTPSGGSSNLNFKKQKIEVAREVFLDEDQQNDILKRVGNDHDKLQACYRSLSIWKVEKRLDKEKKLDDYRQFFKWVIPAVEKEQEKSKNSYEVNEKFAQRIKEKFPDDRRIFLGYNYLEIIHGPTCSIINFKERGFEEKMHDALRKIGKIRKSA